MGYNIYTSLHTSSKYLDGIDIGSFIEKQSQVSSRTKSLEQKELELYKNFGATSFKDFMNKIRELFSNNEDVRALRRFSANNLQSYLAQNASRSNIMGQEVTLDFDVSRLKDLKIKINTKEVKADGKISFTLKYLPKEVKSKLNEIFGKHYIPEKEGMRAVNKFISDQIKNGTLAIESSNSPGNNSSVKTESFIPNYPWGLYIEEIREIEKEGKGPAYDELKKAQNEIKDIVFLKLHGGDSYSNELRRAMENVWNKNFGHASFSAIKFFKGGKTDKFITAVQGSLGEFQAAVLFEYINIKFGNLSNKAVSVIRGNIFSGSEQARTDIEIFNNLGIQVKNFSIQDNKVSDFKTTMHPNKFAKYYLNDGESTTFLGFLANYFFNSTYKDKEKSNFQNLQTYLGTRLGEIMNMAIKEEVADSVSFYYVGGQYLIPGSHILSVADQLTNFTGKSLRESVKIDSNYDGKTDEQYKEGKWKDYWEFNNNTWAPTEKNKTQFKNLISKSISLRTNFNISELLMEDYNLF